MAMPAIFSGHRAIFSERNFEAFCAPITAATRRNTKYTAKHGECAERTACKARCESYSRKRGLSRFLLCHFNVTVSRLFGPASPTASPESEFLSHGRVASRGVCKGAPHKF